MYKFAVLVFALIASAAAAPGYLGPSLLSPGLPLGHGPITLGSPAVSHLSLGSPVLPRLASPLISPIAPVTRIGLAGHAVSPLGLGLAHGPIGAPLGLSPLGLGHSLGLGPSLGLAPSLGLGHPW